MVATKAYIASAGTAAVMLAASLCVLAMVSGLVAFGAWPANATPTSVDEMLVTSIERPKPQVVQVRRNAGLATRASARGTGGGSPTTTAGGTTPSHSTSGSGKTVASAPTGSAPGAATQGGAQGGGQTGASNPVKTVTRTTQPLLQSAPQPVQDVANQVNQVIDQAGSSLPPPPSTVNDTVSGVLGR
jgi:hypothetical protein